jgi:hypothetical protein
MTYIVVKNANYTKFRDECNEMLQRNFTPCGGVCVNVVDDHSGGVWYHYSQAFVGEA